MLESILGSPYFGKLLYAGKGYIFVCVSGLDRPSSNKTEKQHVALYEADSERFSVCGIGLRVSCCNLV